MVFNRQKYPALLISLIFGLLSATQTFWHFHALSSPDSVSVSSAEGKSHLPTFPDGVCLVHQTFSSGLITTTDLPIPASFNDFVFIKTESVFLKHPSLSLPKRGPPSAFC